MKKRLTALALAILLSTGYACAAAEISLANGVTSLDMLKAAYWIDKYAGSRDVIMTKDEIKLYNDICLEMRDADGNGYLNDVLDSPETVNGGEVAKIILSCEVPTGDSYMNGELLPPMYFARLALYRNACAIPETVNVRYAVSVERLNARSFPTNDFIVSEPDDEFYDNIQMSEIMPFKPLLVLHATADGQWLWIRSYAFDGWVPARGVAFFDSREEYLKAFDRDDFLVVTASRMRLEYDPYCPGLSGMELYMGNTLPLSDEAVDSVNRRAAYGSYVVKLPIRGENGKAEFVNALVPVSSDVSVGFIDYTTANCLELAFKLLGERYGWAGLYGANDCSGILGQIFSCFGFKFPRNSRVISSMPTFNVNLANLSNDAKRAIIESLTPGSLLFLPGHIMMYLGSENGDSFVLSAAGSILDPVSGDVKFISGVVVNDLDVLRKNGKTWLESITKATMVNPAGAMDMYGAIRALLGAALEFNP